MSRRRPRRCTRCHRHLLLYAQGLCRACYALSLYYRRQGCPFSLIDGGVLLDEMTQAKYLYGEQTVAAVTHRGYKERRNT